MSKTFSSRRYFAFIERIDVYKVLDTPGVSAEARKEYAERVMRRHKEKAEQG